MNMTFKDSLPGDFVKRMQALLGNEFDSFIDSYAKENAYGLRCNLLKCDIEKFDELMPFETSKVDWAFEGRRAKKEDAPGRHPLHSAGAYYIQEPSAMSAVSVLDPKPGDFVLDLCAAPGGKSTQIAARLKGEGLLVSNEPFGARASILSENVERMGVANAIVTNEYPDRLSSVFTGFFDKILVDAPCSGEGMFKKEENAIGEWSLDNVKACATRQSLILDEAAKMLAPGGTLVYSTCTFAPAEDEEAVSSFIERHPEFSIVESEIGKFFESGRSDFCKEVAPATGIDKTMRLWPHKLDGEGHYVAKLVKQGSLPAHKIYADDSKPSKKSQGPAIILNDIRSFMKNELHIQDRFINRFTDSKVTAYGDNIYLTPGALPPLGNLKVVRPGLCVASSKKNRLEPAHSLAMALTPEDVESICELSEADAGRFLHGETPMCDPNLKGWVIVTHKGFSMGWAKLSAGNLKNHYPKGLRTMY